MSEEIKGLIMEMGKAFEQFKAANDARIAEIEKRGHADPLLVEKVEKASAGVGEISAEMKRRLDAIEVEMAKRDFPAGGRAADATKMAHAEAFTKWFRKGVDAGLRDLEVRAGLSTMSDPDAGFLVPEEMEAGIDRVVGTVSAMRRLASVRVIGTDTYKKLVSQGGTGAGWVGEKASRTETDTPTLAEIAINAKELYANPAATQAILDDARIDIGAWLADEVSVEFAEQEGAALINGNGVEKPKGINAYTKVANASYAWGKVGYIATGSNAIGNADCLFDLMHALKPAYRAGAAWLMNDATLNKIRQMKDGEGNYLWRPGLEMGAPETLLGKPVETDDNVDDIGSGKYPVYFANFRRAYLILDRFGIRVLRNPYLNPPYVYFYTTKRVGGGIVMYEAIKALKTYAS